MEEAAKPLLFEDVRFKCGFAWQAWRFLTFSDICMQKRGLSFCATGAKNLYIVFRRRVAVCLAGKALRRPLSICAAGAALGRVPVFVFANHSVRAASSGVNVECWVSRTKCKA